MPSGVLYCVSRTIPVEMHLFSVFVMSRERTAVQFSDLAPLQHFRMNDLAKRNDGDEKVARGRGSGRVSASCGCENCLDEPRGRDCLNKIAAQHLQYDCSNSTKRIFLKHTRQKLLHAGMQL